MKRVLWITGLIISSLIWNASLAIAITGTSTSWPMLGHDAGHSGFSPDTVLKPPLKVKWRYIVGKPKGVIYASPVIAEGMVFLPLLDSYNNLKVFALNASTGEKQWEYPLSISTEYWRPYYSCAVADGLVYANGDNKIYALRTTTGEKQWEFSLAGTAFSSPVVANGTVYIGSSRDWMQGYIYALNNDGTVKWQKSVPGAHLTPAVVPDDGVYIATIDENYCCSILRLDTETGKSHQVYSFYGKFHSLLTIVDGILYFTAYEFSEKERVYAIDLSTNSRKWWSYPIEQVVSDLAPAVAYGMVYVVTMNGTIYAFDSQTGEEKWRRSLGVDCRGSLAVANGVVYVNTYSRLSEIYALNAENGTIIWSHSGLGGESAPAIANGTLYACSEAGRIHAFVPGTPTVSSEEITLVSPQANCFISTNEVSSCSLQWDILPGITNAMYCIWVDNTFLPFSDGLPDPMIPISEFFQRNSVPEGTHTWRVEVEYVKDGQSYIAKSPTYTFVVYTPPQWGITSPLANQWTEGVVTIEGSAYGMGFVNYSLEYKKKGEAQWHQMVVDASPAINQDLCQWDTQGLSDGEYTLKLDPLFEGPTAPSGGGEPIYHQIRVDNTPPTAKILPLPLISNQGEFKLNWQGDDGEGSGVESFDVEYKKVPTDTYWRSWRDYTSSTSDWFYGQEDCTYQFKIRARDRMGHTGDWSKITSVGIGGVHLPLPPSGLEIDSDGIHISIPSGAVESLTEIIKFSTSPPSSKPFDPLIKEECFCYKFESSDQRIKKFNKPVSVTIPIPIQPQGASLRVYYSSSPWTLLPVSCLQVNGNTVTVTSELLGEFLIVSYSQPSQPLSLVTNFPNPFAAGNESTAIQYALNKDKQVRVKVYDLLGKLVWETAFEPGSQGGRQGINKISWDGRNGEGQMVETGVYLCVIETEGGKATRKIGVK